MSHNSPPTNTNLGNGYASMSSPAGAMSSSSDNIPSMGLVYSHPSQPQPESKPMNQQITYQQTIYQTSQHDFPKHHNHGWPEYGRSTIYVDRASLYNPYYLNPYRIHDDRISQFFIGSATVIGLFILYRILEKNK